MGKRWIPLGEWGVLLLMALSVLWKGGKGLEAVWLLSALAFVLTLLTWRMKFQERQSAMQDVPVGLWITALLFIVWTVMSYIFSQTRNYGLDEVFATASLTLLFLWVVRMRAAGLLTLVPRLFAPTIALVTSIAVFIGTLLYALQPVDRFVGTFFDWRFHTDYWPNAWAQYLLLAWPLFLVALMNRTLNKAVQRGLIAALGLVIGALFLSYSRGAFIAFSGQIVLMALLFGLHAYSHAAKRPDVALRSIIPSILMGAAVATLFFFTANALRSMQFDVQSVAEKATFTAAEGRSSVSERTQFWKQAAYLTTERPIFGWGPYSFRFIQTLSMEDVLATSDHPHNMLLKLSMERGIPAALLILLLCGFVITSGLTAVIRRGDIHAIFLLTALAGVCAHNLIDYNLQFIGITLPLVLMAALLVERSHARLHQPHPHPASLRLRRVLVRSETILVLLLSALLLWEGAHLSMSSPGRHAEAAGKTQEALQWYRRSENALFSRDMYLSMARLLIDARAYGQAQEALGTYVSLNTEDARAWKLHGELALRMGRDAEAVTSLAKAFDLGRFTDASILHLYILSLSRRQDDAVLESSQKLFEDTFLRFAEAIEANAHFVALSHNPEELVLLSQRLAAAYPESSIPFASIAQSALNHAEEERATFAGRAPGILW